jgi:hypothetical protein
MKLSKYQGDSRVSVRPSSSMFAKMSISREISEREISRRIDRVFFIQQLAFLKKELGNDQSLHHFHVLTLQNSQFLLK